jgi:hypothetical protein
MLITVIPSMSSQIVAALQIVFGVWEAERRKVNSQTCSGMFGRIVAALLLAAACC